MPQHPWERLLHPGPHDVRRGGPAWGQGQGRFLFARVTVPWGAGHGRILPRAGRSAALGGTGADCPRSPRQSLLFLGLVSAVCLGLNLLFLTVYLICLCCCRRDQEPETKRPHSCCVTWMAVTAGLICW